MNSCFEFLTMCCLNISPDSWIQLVSGLGAVVVALLAIIHGNKNSRKALDQQNRIIQYQHNEKRLDEYNGCLRDNPRLSVRYVLVSRRFTHTILGSSICFQMGAWVKHAC